MTQIKEKLNSLFITACMDGDLTIIILLISFYNDNPQYLYYYDMMLESGLSRAISNNHLHILMFFIKKYKKNKHYIDIIKTSFVLADKRSCSKEMINYIKSCGYTTVKDL